MAAAGDNADAGLPGVHSRFRNVNQRKLLVEDMESCIEIAEVLPNLAGMVDRSLWNTRGWTFQERFLSRRCIFFTDVQVYFRCRRSLRYEGDDVDGSSEALRGHATLGSFETGEFIADPFSYYKRPWKRTAKER